MTVSSEFYKDLSKIEKKVWGISLRQLKAYLFLVLDALVLLVEVFLLPDIAFILLSIPTALALGVYPTFLLLNSWREKKRKLELYFYYQDRHYTTGQIRRYAAHEFTQKETVKETDCI